MRVKLLLLGYALCLASCSDVALVEQHVGELNQRIDKLDIMSEEILIRANSMNELELTVSAMEERQSSRLRRVLAREAIAKKRVLELDSEILEMEARIALLEEESKSYPKTLAAKKKATEARLKRVLDEVERTVDLSPRPGEERVVFIERLLERSADLEAENAKLREALTKKGK